MFFQKYVLPSNENIKTSLNSTSVYELIQAAESLSSIPPVFVEVFISDLMQNVPVGNGLGLCNYI